jgi:cell division septum initiation protein DivIVA
MAREITPDTIRETALKRRLRGYDPRETEQLLADVAESLERLMRERSSLREQTAGMRKDLDELGEAFKDEVKHFNETLTARDQRLSEVQSELTRLQDERSKHTEERERLTEELSGAKADRDNHEETMTELRETVARFETREKALLEQIAMLESQLEHTDDREATAAEQQVLADLDDRTSTTLLRLDRAIETVEREAHEQAELLLKRAHEKAEEIVRSAEVQRQAAGLTAARSHAPDEGGDEYDPVAALGRVEDVANEEPTTTDPSEGEVGEAAWTLGRNSQQLPERYS